MGASEPLYASIPAVDGMTINTKDGLLQQVKIRVRSLGSPVCGVQVIFAGEARIVSALATSWTDWISVGPAVSGGAYQLSFQPQCETGAVGEVLVETD